MIIMGKNKQLGDGIFSTGNRTFKRHFINKKWTSELICWIQKKCIDCGKFLSKHNYYNRCSRCSKNHNRLINKIISKKKYHNDENYRIRKLEQCHDNYIKKKVLKNMNVCMNVKI